MSDVDTGTPSFLGRLSQLPGFTLEGGGHADFDAGMCAMECVAWLAGEKWSDTPACACPVIAACVRRLNDRIPYDDMRTELLMPLVPKLLNTRASREVMVRRGCVAADMAVRVFAPMALEKRGRLDLANRLRGVAEIVDAETARAAQAETIEVRNAAADDAYAANAADAAANAADAAAYAAANAADAAAYAADDAAAYAAAYAAYDADDDAADDLRAARREVYILGVQMVEKMLAVVK